MRSLRLPRRASLSQKRSRAILGLLRSPLQPKRRPGVGTHEEERDMARLVVADPAGQMFDHPRYEMVGRLGAAAVEVPPEDLLHIPEGTKLFTMPGSHPLARDPRSGDVREVTRTQIGG